MKTTWYLHAPLVWLKLSNLSIVEDLPVCLAAHGEIFFDGHCRKRQTPTASPAKPGELPMGSAKAVGLMARSPRRSKLMLILVSSGTHHKWLQGHRPGVVAKSVSRLRPLGEGVPAPSPVSDAGPRLSAPSRTPCPQGDALADMKML